MKYLSLYKKFFITDDNAQKEYDFLFNSPNTNKLNIEIHKNQAFYIINKEMLDLVESIYSINTRIINKTKGKSIYQKLFNHELMKEIQASLELENVICSQEEIKELINSHNLKEYKRFYGFVKKYQEIMNKDAFEPLLSSKEIRALYNSIMYKDIEKENKKNIPDGIFFRKESVEVQSGGRAIHEGIYPEDKIILMMDEALNTLNDEKICLLIRVGIFHYLFGYIHPFYDGNGRMSRYLSSYYLSTKLDPLCALQLSIACKQNQAKYYESFKITNDIRNKADLTYFILSFLEILESGLLNLEKDINIHS